MPSPKSKDAEPTPQADDPAVTDTPEPAEVPAVEVEKAPAPSGPPPGVYAYTHFADCVYPHVPLSARAATPDTPGTVFAWPFGPPADGRWEPTTQTPNQAADNAGPLTIKE